MLYNWRAVFVYLFIYFDSVNFLIHISFFPGPGIFLSRIFENINNFLVNLF